MFYDPRTGKHGLPHNPFKSLVAPRPIGWISTVSKDGVPNIGPYSFFNAVAERPHMVMFSSSYRPNSDLRKDSHWNAEETGEFVVNIVTEALSERMNVTSGPYDPQVDEFARAGLTPAPCRNVKTPRIAESPVSLECKHFQTVRLPAHPPDRGNVMVIGEVIGIHIADEILSDGMVDMAKFRPLARLGYWQYTVVDNAFWMHPPGE